MPLASPASPSLASLALGAALLAASVVCVCGSVVRGSMMHDMDVSITKGGGR